jgi:hypothetical protein
VECRILPLFCMDGYLHGRTDWSCCTACFRSQLGRLAL